MPDPASVERGAKKKVEFSSAAEPEQVRRYYELASLFDPSMEEVKELDGVVKPGASNFSKFWESGSKYVDRMDWPDEISDEQVHEQARTVTHLAGVMKELLPLYAEARKADAGRDDANPEVRAFHAQQVLDSNGVAIFYDHKTGQMRPEGLAQVLQWALATAEKRGQDVAGDKGVMSFSAKEIPQLVADAQSIAGAVNADLLKYRDAISPADTPA